MRHPTWTEQKLVVLYALGQLGGTTSEQLLRFLMENQQMDYMEMKIAIAELTESGMLRKMQHELGALYDLSEEGITALGLFEKKIPFSRREQMLLAAKDFRERFRLEKQVLADYTEQKSGDYLVRLRLMEQELTLLDLQVSVPTRTLANQVVRHWPGRADTIYATLMQTLGEDEETHETPEH